MKRKWMIWCLMILIVSSLSAQNVYVEENVKLPSHPRLLLKKGEEKKLLKQVKKDAIWLDIHNAILEEADEIIAKPVNERKLTGFRLLSVSVENVHRIFFLSYAYRMTGQEKYFKRAEAEMLKAASFVDWNPNHFLDTAEMTMALAIGYDWLYNKLSNESKQIIENAIIEKGIIPSYDESSDNPLRRSNTWFLTVDHNWNQVCNGGITYGALAIWEKNPELASRTVNRAIGTISSAMKKYSPDGAYPEGVGYWNYGTSFNAMFLSAVEKIFGTDFELSSIPGFLKSGQFILNMSTTDLKCFGYSDSSSSNASFFPTMFWFYDKTKDASILYNHARLYKEKGSSLVKSDRFAPALMIWGASASMQNPKVPEKLNWKADGENPLVTMRASWTDSKAAYLGVKLGTPSANHAHMDVGSFFYENDGVIWAMDLGGENYNQVETAGANIWDSSQEGQRWDVYRYNNFAHNTLTFNKKHQIVKGRAEIESYVEKANQTTVVSDLTPVYEGQVDKIRRAFSFVDKKYAVIEDEVTAGKWFTMMSWTLVTPATAKVVSDNVVLLETEGKKLYVKVDAPASIRWRIEPAEPVYSFNSKNPGISLVRFDTDLKLNVKQLIKVFLIPEENKNITYTSAF